MNRRPGQTRVTTEVAYCSFCGRPRTLRREEHQLGTLVRTIVTCETCHRTLSSTMGVAAPEPVAAKPEPEPAGAAAPASDAPGEDAAPARKKRTTTPATRAAGKTASERPSKPGGTSRGKSTTGRSTPKK